MTLSNKELQTIKELHKNKYGASIFRGWQIKGSYEKRKVLPKLRTLKRCCNCKTYFPKNDQYFHKASKFQKLHNYCKYCNNLKVKEGYKNNTKSKNILNLRLRLTTALKVYTDTGKLYSSKVYGINYKGIIDYLGECPGKREDWHIDHIFPLSAFDLSDPEQVRLAFLPENHQWLLKEENLSKGNKYNKKDLEIYIKKHSIK